MFRKIALGIAILMFLTGASLCLADSKEVAREGTYVAYDDGLVKDTNTGLEWIVGPDKDIAWQEAKSWVEGLNAGNAGWRMPKMNELEGLYQQGVGERNMTPLLKTTGWWVWSKDFKEGSPYSVAWNFSFFYGNGRWNCPKELTDRRAFAVRP